MNAQNWVRWGWGIVASLILTSGADAANRVVFLAGGRSHGPGEHEFNAGCQLLARVLNEQSGLDVQATVIQGWPKDESVLDGIRALVIYADGTSVVGKGWAKVDSLAAKGVGILFMHYAVHPSPEEGEKYYRPWIGGAFEEGWSVNPHWVADMKALPNHPVSRGVTPLVQAYDEFYYNMRFPKDRAKVLDLVTAVPTRERVKRYINLWNENGVAGLDRTQTLMWGIERPDGGRGVGFTGGHYHRNWAVDGFRTLALNAIVWTAGIEVPMSGVKSRAVSEDELNANLDDKGPVKPRLTLPLPGEFAAIRAAAVQTEREQGFGKPAGKPEKPPTGASRGEAPRAKTPIVEGPPFVPPDMFTTVEDLEVTLWATSPLLFNPTNMDFDDQGRLYVAEGVNYRGNGGRRPEGDRIVVLEDTTGAGKADKTTVFVQEPALASPLGVAVFDNKIVVSQPPDMIVYTDVNRDGKFDSAVDRREVLLTGFGGRQHDHSLHSVTAGPDGQWYWNQGNTGAKFTDKSGQTFRMGSPYMMQNIAGQTSDDGNVWIGGFTARMNPDGTRVKILGHNYRNSYEQTVTSMGDIFQSDNDDPPACRVTAILEGGNAGFASADGRRAWEADRRPGQDTPTAEWRQEDPGTMPAGDVYGGGSPTGVAYYENGALGDKWRGLLLACEAGKNVVFGYVPKAGGAGFKLERFDFLTSNKEKQWAGSDFLGGKPTGELKTMFRPSDVCVGPDGAIYVADWFDPGVGGHATRDNGLNGSIYRIAPKGFKSRVPKLNLATTEGQIAALKSPAVNLRYTGFERLRQKGPEAVPAVAALLTDPNRFIAARSVWLLAQMGDAGRAKVTPLLSSKDAAQRLIAYRALRAADHDVLAMARRMANDESAGVRREVAVTLRGVPVEKSVDTLVTLARGFDGRDRAYLEALGLGSRGKEQEVYAAVAKVMGGPAENWTDAFAWIAWRLHPEDAVNDFKTRVLSATLSNDQRKLMLTALAFVPSRLAAGAMIEIANAKNVPFQDLAKWWLLNRKGNDWQAYDVEGGMKALGIYDPDKVELVGVEMPPEKADAPALPSVAEILKLSGDVERGQRAATAVCSVCHRIGAVGVEYGPALTTFGQQQTREVLVQAIVQPSASISHGFEGSEVKTKEGLTITGMVLSTGDPLIIKCMGGLVQTVPQSRIVSVKIMTRSLMYTAGMLSLDAQSIADITAYLKSL
ncbi:MAG: c-type cytochrome [Pedosphaera sp.]|nr:c-type cytochrome [Pedosphaera sp.]